MNTMNERIRAHDLWTQVCQEDMPELDETCMTMRRTRKFAELIVQECIKCCAEIDDINKTYREVRLVDPEFGTKECIATIKEHFGVEE